MGSLLEMHCWRGYRSIGNTIRGERQPQEGVNNEISIKATADVFLKSWEDYHLTIYVWRDH